MSPGQEDEVLTVREIAGRLKLTEETIRRWLREGRLRGVRFSDAAGWRVRASEVERILAGPSDSAPTGVSAQAQLHVAEAAEHYDVAGGAEGRQGKAAAA